MLLGKLEELYLLLLELGERNGRRFEHLIPVADEESEAPSQLPFTEKLAADLLERVELLVDFYFPQLQPDLEALFEANRECIRLLFLSPSDRPPYSEVRTAAIGFGDANGAIQKRILAERPCLTKTLTAQIAEQYDRMSNG